MNSELKVGFFYTAVLRDVDGTVLSATSAKNIFPAVGRNHILDSAIGGGVHIQDWYIGLFRSAYTPMDADTMANFPAAAVEITAYSQPARLALVANAANAGVLDSVGHEVVFTLTADTPVYGGFIASSQSKGSTLGVLLSAVRFATPQQGYVGQTVTIGAVCSLINV